MDIKKSTISSSGGNWLSSGTLCQFCKSSLELGLLTEKHIQSQSDASTEQGRAEPVQHRVHTAGHRSGLWNTALPPAAPRNSSSKNEGINREGRSKFHTLRKGSAPLNLTQELAHKHAVLLCDANLQCSTSSSRILTVSSIEKQKKL